MDTIVWGINTVLIIIGLQYIVGPILVLRSQKFPHEYKCKLLDPEKFESERTETFIYLNKKILYAGFEYIGSFELIQSHSSMYVSIYNNFDLKLACTLSTAHSAAMNTTQMEFTQMYRDGSVLNVSNAPLFNIYPYNEKKLCFRFPEINNFDELFHAAHHLINAHKTVEERVTFERGAEIATIEDHLNNELGFLINKGWVSKRPTNNERRPTLKGAILMTWQLCWPVKQILGKKDTYLSKKMLENI